MENKPTEVTNEKNLILDAGTNIQDPKERETLSITPYAKIQNIRDKSLVRKKLVNVKNFGSGMVDFLCCRFDPDDTLCAVVWEATVSVVEKNYFQDKAIHSLYGSDGQGMPITCLRWRPHGGISKTKHILVSACADGSLSHWHVSSGKLLHRIHEQDNQILALDYNLDGSQFATAGKDRIVRVYDENTKSIVTNLEGGIWQHPGHSNRIFSLKFHPKDPNVIVTGGWDNTIYYWDVRAGRSVGAIYGPAISGDAIDIKGDFILTGSWRNKEQLELWDFGSRKRINVINWDYGYNIENAYVYSCQFSKKDNDTICAGCSNLNEFKVFDRTKDYRNILKASDMKKGVYSVDYANTTDYISFCGGDGHLHVVQIANDLQKEENIQ